MPLDAKLAAFLGKGGSENSITYYNRKVGDDVMVFLAPSSIDEKFYAVAELLTVAGQVVMSTSSVDRLFGELLVACSLLGKHVIFTKDNGIDSLLSSAKVADSEFSEKEGLLSRIAAKKPAPAGQAVRVDLDKAFNVKGIGMVALGIVTKGAVKVHDELYHGAKKVTVRSIQSQDVDVQEAGLGTRVGLALKGIEADEIDKGDLLTTEPNQKVSKVSASLEVSRIGKEELLVGKSYSLVSNFSVSRATLESVSEGNCSFKLERPLTLQAGDEFLLIREQVPRIFAKGKAVL
jgi:selenocysteine-specific translation elongation factor